MTGIKTLLQAAWVAPIERPIIRDGAIAFQKGIIQEVGSAEQLRRKHADAHSIDLGAATILPGLVNPHTHLELSSCTNSDAPTSFTDWILSLRQRAGFTGKNDESAVETALRAGIEQCLRYGVTTVGDISRLPSLTRPRLASSPLRAVSFGEVLAIAKFRDRATQQIASAIDPLHANDHLRIGITPHAPYTVEPNDIRLSLETARHGQLPLTMHLAELPYEREFLAHHQGPFRKLLEKLDQWDDHVPKFEGGPIRYAHSLGLLDYPTLLAHVNYCDDAELEILSRGQASVVYCPRTHAHFGHPPHRWREMLKRGINVAIGTDSCASSPNLNLLDDLRMVHSLAPDFPVDELWSMGTTRAARALQWQDRVGSIARGKHADFIAFETTSSDPLLEILGDKLEPQQVWIDGVRIDHQLPYSGG